MHEHSDSPLHVFVGIHRGFLEDEALCLLPALGVATARLRFRHLQREEEGASCRTFAACAVSAIVVMSFVAIVMFCS